ncbi:MAG: hypothetical protein JMDDDDMK_05593 [Acidobacteria bacterium]|nr:hypothetical protein [Acidobacteriota bacterium]
MFDKLSAMRGSKNPTYPAKAAGNFLARRSAAILATTCLLAGLALAQAHHQHEMAARSSANANAPKTAKPIIFAGEAQPVGNGTARPWVATDKDGKPTAIGVTFSEAALSGLPQSLTPGLIWTEFILPLPPEAAATGFDHIGLNWNPKGHDPEGVYKVPHFDFHFYLISPAARERITTRGEDLERCRKPLPPEFVPEGYILAPASEEPGMGSHWVEPNSHEFHGKAFTHTFIYGSYDGRMIFAEPMISKAFLETKPDITVPVKLPAKYQKPGYYPTQYSVKYYPEAREYTVAIEGLTLR